MPNVVKMQLPRGVNARGILGLLLFRKRRSTRDLAMNWNWHHCCRSVRKPHVGAGKGDLHEMFCEIARRMAHSLMRRSDVDAGRVVVRAEMSAAQSSVGCIADSREQRRSFRVHDDLRSLYHKLEQQTSSGEGELLLQPPKNGDSVLDLFDDRDFRNSYDPALRQATVFDKLRHYELESAHASNAHFFVER